MARILVIDDEANIRSLCKRILEQAGHEVREAVDGNQGTTLYRQHCADLVITDILMPQKEGIETITELRRDFPQMKIIAISGGGQTMSSSTCLQLAKRLGAAKTLAKPFSRQELSTAVQEVLNDR